MRLSQVGWTIAIVSCITSRSVKESELQRVQNAAARIALDLSKFCHITPALRQLHWLPVIKRIQFKILLLSFKAIHGPFPPYISELVTVKPKSTYGHRSSNSTLLLPTAQKMLPALGARSFCCCCPALWNKLPADIRNVASLNSFKNQSRPLFFTNHFNFYTVSPFNIVLILYEIFVKTF